ncbi:hypothetical protein GH714_029349 [Hevea brasiliensis]|uniref:Xylanase inhibitor C-terminal domain-containing protein n=1 Tax=Hevea brasiliensis TaxID=3981 RepID=A0A6A6LVV9_HEVBR|nr:hypothetical protein GH714_029349 [Hevea brasiliensis]
MSRVNLFVDGSFMMCLINGVNALLCNFGGLEVGGGINFGLAVDSALGVTVLQQPLSDVWNRLRADKHGVSWPRFVHCNN